MITAEKIYKEILEMPISQNLAVSSSVLNFGIFFIIIIYLAFRMERFICLSVNILSMSYTINSDGLLVFIDRINNPVIPDAESAFIFTFEFFCLWIWERVIC